MTFDIAMLIPIWIFSATLVGGVVLLFTAPRAAKPVPAFAGPPVLRAARVAS
jgi:hypothetical protein